MFWFKKKPKVNIAELGVIDDPRPVEEKEKDFQAEEVAMFAPVKWEEKPESEWHKYPIFFQDGSSSCVAQASSKILGIENFLEEGKFVHFSARDIYTRRANYPGKGMWFQNALQIIREHGATFEQLMPSQGMNESAMNDSGDRTLLDEIVSKPARGGNYLALPLDIEAIASTIGPQGKPVLIGVRFGPKEWSREVPVILTNDIRYHHGIVVVDYFKYGCKKALLIEDSWGINSGKDGRRIVTEDWFNANRISFAGYVKALKNDGLADTEKPQYTFKNDLKYGMRANEEIKILQKCLAYLRMFPSDVDYTGNFYGITLKAVQLFQQTYGIKPVSGYVGRLTRTKLNELF